MRFHVGVLLVFGIANGAFGKPGRYLLGYQDSLGQYSFGYSAPDLARSEVREADGSTRGVYSYVDGAGIIQSTEYTADQHNGFRVTATNLPQAPLPVQETPEVAAARTAHLMALEEARSAASIPEGSSSIEEPSIVLRIAPESSSSLDQSQLPDSSPAIEQARPAERTLPSEQTLPIESALPVEEAQPVEQARPDEKALPIEEALPIDSAETSQRSGEPSEEIPSSEGADAPRLAKVSQTDESSDQGIRFEQRWISTDVERKAGNLESREQGKGAPLFAPVEVPSVIGTVGAPLAVPLIPVNYDLPSVEGFSARSTPKVDGLPEAMSPQGAEPARPITPAGTTLKSLGPLAVAGVPRIQSTNEDGSQQRVAPGGLIGASPLDFIDRARAYYGPVNVIPVPVAVGHPYNAPITPFLGYSTFPYVAYNVL